LLTKYCSHRTEISTKDIVTDPIINSGSIGEEGGLGTIPKGRSIALNIFNNQTTVFLSFDIDTAGEIAGIVQISAEIVRFKINSAKKKVGSDHAGDILQEEDTFNRYINPVARPEYWDQHSISVRGILPDSERIINAGNMRTVWPEFQRWFFSIVSPAEMVVLVAWNGETCDLKWLWMLTQAPNSRYSLPDNIKYFIDPYRVIEKYKTCPFNKTKSKIEAYELGIVWIWKYANNGSNLMGPMTVSLMCVHRRIFSPIHVLYHLLIALRQFSQSMKFSQGLFRTSGKRTWSRLILCMCLGLSSPRNTT
jgi:hypothetical protein